MGKLEDASEDRGSSSRVAAASKSCKTFMILSELHFLQVALISKSMGIKSPVVHKYKEQCRKTELNYKESMN